MPKPINIDEYISGFPKDTQKILEPFRMAVKKSAPQAEETISYGIPSFKLKGMLVWFAAHTNHIGFYPRASAIEAFKKELLIYKSAKGSVQFPLSKPLLLGLISKIIKFRIKENVERAEIKMKKNKPLN